MGVQHESPAVACWNHSRITAGPKQIPRLTCSSASSTSLSSSCLAAALLLPAPPSVLLARLLRALEACDAATVA